MRCHKCQEQLEGLIPDIRNSDWLKLFYYLEHELHEEEITNATFMDLTDALTTLRPEEVKDGQ